MVVRLRIRVLQAFSAGRIGQNQCGVSGEKEHGKAVSEQVGKGVAVSQGHQGEISAHQTEKQRAPGLSGLEGVAMQRNKRR